MPAQPLTDVLIRSLKPPLKGRIEITDARCRGLELRMTASGERSWAFRYRDRTGRVQRLTLGRYPDLGLADARARADAARRVALDGGNPAVEKREARANADKLTFEHLADRYLAEHARRFKKSADADERHLKLHVRPKWGRRPYGEIKRRDVIELVEGLYGQGKAALAVRVKALVSKVFAFAISRDLVEANPASGIGRIADLPPRERVLSNDEIRLAWVAAMLPPVSRRVGLALRLVLATGQRPGEVAGMHLSELEHLDDANRALWRLPGSRAKNGREHVVPLSPLAVKIVTEAVAEDGEEGRSRGFVFPSPRGGRAGPVSPHALAVAMARIVKRLDPAVEESERHPLADAPGAGTWRAESPTPHDLRRTAATRMRALGVSSDDVQRVLNHAQTTVLGKVYDRHLYEVEKRSALERWGRELERIVGGEPAGKVVPLRRPSG
jgi:integrase